MELIFKAKWISFFTATSELVDLYFKLKCMKIPCKFYFSKQLAQICANRSLMIQERYVQNIFMLLILIEITNPPLVLAIESVSRIILQHIETFEQRKGSDRVTDFDIDRFLRKEYQVEFFSFVILFLVCFKVKICPHVGSVGNFHDTKATTLSGGKTFLFHKLIF